MLLNVLFYSLCGEDNDLFWNAAVSLNACVCLREWWPTVSLSLSLWLSDALQGHSFPVHALDLVSAHRWIHFRCSCRHISCLKTTHARTSIQTACWHSAGHFSTAHPLRSSIPWCLFSSSMHSPPHAHLYPALHLLPLTPKQTTHLSDKGHTMSLWGLFNSAA